MTAGIVVVNGIRYRIEDADRLGLAKNKARGVEEAGRDSAGDDAAPAGRSSRSRGKARQAE